MELNTDQLKYIKIHKHSKSYSASLIDNEEHEITKGYGSTIVDALNDMHGNLI